MAETVALRLPSYHYHRVIRLMKLTTVVRCNIYLDRAAGCMTVWHASSEYCAKKLWKSCAFPCEVKDT